MEMNIIGVKIHFLSLNTFTFPGAFWELENINPISLLILPFNNVISLQAIFIEA